MRDCAGVHIAVQPSCAGALCKPWPTEVAAARLCRGRHRARWSRFPGCAIVRAVRAVEETTAMPMPSSEERVLQRCAKRKRMKGRERPTTTQRLPVLVASVVRRTEIRSESYAPQSQRSFSTTFTHINKPHSLSLCTQPAYPYRPPFHPPPFSPSHRHSGHPSLPSRAPLRVYPAAASACSA